MGQAALVSPQLLSIHSRRLEQENRCNDRSQTNRYKCEKYIQQVRHRIVFGIVFHFEFLRRH
jgi:hypothetical protein